MASKHVSVEAVQVQGYKIEAKSREHLSLIDQPIPSGGTDSGPTPLEYMFIALASCVVTIGYLIAKQRQLPVRSIQVKVEGDLDPDVFMGKTTEVRAGFTGIQVHTKIDAEMSQEEKEQLMKDIDARCPISDNLHNLTPISFVVE